MQAASLPMRRASLRRRLDAPREATGAVGARRGPRDTRREAVVVGGDAVDLGAAALGARRAARRLCVDAGGLRKASLRVGTDDPSIPTDALVTRKGTVVISDGGSTSTQRRPRKSTGSSTRRTRRPTRTSGRSARSSGCSRDSRGRRAKARTGFARNHAVLVHFSARPTRLGSGGVDARSDARHATRRIARASGRRAGIRDARREEDDALQWAEMDTDRSRSDTRERSGRAEAAAAGISRRAHGRWDRSEVLR